MVKLCPKCERKHDDEKDEKNFCSQCSGPTRLIPFMVLVDGATCSTRNIQIDAAEVPFKSLRSSINPSGTTKLRRVARGCTSGQLTCNESPEDLKDTDIIETGDIIVASPPQRGDIPPPRDDIRPPDLFDKMREFWHEIGPHKEEFELKIKQLDDGFEKLIDRMKAAQLTLVAQQKDREFLKAKQTHEIIEELRDAFLGKCEEFLQQKDPKDPIPPTIPVDRTARKTINVDVFYQAEGKVETHQIDSALPFRNVRLKIFGDRLVASEREGKPLKDDDLISDGDTITVPVPAPPPPPLVHRCNVGSSEEIRCRAQTYENKLHGQCGLTHVEMFTFKVGMRVLAQHSGGGTWHPATVEVVNGIENTISVNWAERLDASVVKQFNRVRKEVKHMTEPPPPSPPPAVPSEFHVHVRHATGKEAQDIKQTIRMRASPLPLREVKDQIPKDNFKVAVYARVGPKPLKDDDDIHFKPLNDDDDVNGGDKIEVHEECETCKKVKTGHFVKIKMCECP